MICYFNRFYVDADYKAPYNDIESPLFIGLSCGIMYKTSAEMLETAEKWRKDRKKENVHCSIIPAGELNCFALEV